MLDYRSLTELSRIEKSLNTILFAVAMHLPIAKALHNFNDLHYVSKN